MSVDLTVQNPASAKDIPQPAQLRDWVNTSAAFEGKLQTPFTLTIRVVDPIESAALNETYRQKQGPTNVLSFSYDDEHDDNQPHLGDLAICSEVLLEEATKQDIPIEAHWAHLVVHGTLHLLGYDHETSPEAEEMESLEIRILAQLGYPNPYKEID